MSTWRTISEETVFSAEPFLRVVQQKIDVGRGKVIDDFFQVHLRSFVITVPVLENGKILTIWQYKHGAGRKSLTFPAGFVEDGETPEKACRRELLEETGLVPVDTIHLGEFVDNGNQRGCIGNYYIHKECKQIKKPCSGDLEEMELREMSVAEIDKAVFDGAIAITHHAAAWSMARLHGF